MDGVSGETYLLELVTKMGLWRGVAGFCLGVSRVVSQDQAVAGVVSSPRVISILEFGVCQWPWQLAADTVDSTISKA